LKVEESHLIMRSLRTGGTLSGFRLRLMGMAITCVLIWLQLL